MYRGAEIVLVLVLETGRTGRAGHQARNLEGLARTRRSGTAHHKIQGEVGYTASYAAVSSSSVEAGQSSRVLDRSSSRAASSSASGGSRCPDNWAPRSRMAPEPTYASRHPLAPQRQRLPPTTTDV